MDKASIFGPSIVAKWLDESRWQLGVEGVLGPGHIVLDGEPAHLPKYRAEHQFSAHVYCGQTAAVYASKIGISK